MAKPSIRICLREVLGVFVTVGKFSPFHDRGHSSCFFVLCQQTAVIYEE